MPKPIDESFQPTTYSRPEDLEEKLVSMVKGEAMKRQVTTLLSEGRHDEAVRLVMEMTDGNRKALESLHPMFMGGNYLPDTDIQEVEVARIAIRSTTYDVTCVYAKPDQGVIHYRVVDEYDGDTLEQPTVMESAQPLTLAQLADFFLRTWPLTDVLERNGFDDLESQLAFFSAESSFYPEFDLLCRKRVADEFHRNHGNADSDEE